MIYHKHYKAIKFLININIFAQIQNDIQFIKFDMKFNGIFVNVNFFVLTSNSNTFMAKTHIQRNQWNVFLGSHCLVQNHLTIHWNWNIVAVRRMRNAMHVILLRRNFYTFCHDTHSLYVSSKSNSVTNISNTLTYYIVRSTWVRRTSARISVSFYFIIVKWIILDIIALKYMYANEQSNNIRKRPTQP